MSAGHLRLDVALSLTGGADTRTQRCPEVLPECAPEEPPEHVQRQSFGTARLVGSLAVGLVRGLQVEASLPLVLKDYRLSFTLPDGRPYDPPYTTLSGPTGPSFGLGDARIVLRAAGRPPASPVVLGVSVGAMLPTGRTAPNPFGSSVPAGEREHRQFGNGSVDPVADAAFVLGTRPFGLLVSGAVRVPVHKNVHGKLGSFVGTGSAGLLASMPAPPLTLVLLARATHTGVERWDGAVAENSGRDDLAVVLGIEGRLRPGLVARAELVANAVERVQGTQFSLPATVSLGLSGTFDPRRRGPRPDAP